MILQRYLIKDVFITTMAVLVFLTLLMLGGRLIRYFGVAAQGGLDVAILFALVGFKLPSFLVLILPLSFFVGLMLVIGRLYVDNEMAIIQSAGISARKLAALLWPLVLAMVIIQGILSLVAAPWGNYSSEKLQREQAIKSAFDLVQPKTFISANEYSLYVGNVDKRKGELVDVLLIETNAITSDDEPPKDVIILAKRAVQVAQHTDQEKSAIAGEQTQSNVIDEELVTTLDLYDGRRYELGSGSLAYNEIAFSQYRLRLSQPSQNNQDSLQIDAQSTWRLIDRFGDPAAQAELGFRLSLPLVMVLAWVLAVPLAKVNPRQGRWLKLLPSIVLFATSVVALISLQSNVAAGEVTVLIYLAVFAVYLALAVFIYNKNRLKQHVRSKLAEGSKS